MITVNTNESHTEAQPIGLDEVKAIIDAIDSSPIHTVLNAYRRTGRKGHSIGSLWRAYLASFALNLPSTNALIRRLQEDKELRLLCGFSTLPGRRSFNRFIMRLSDHADLIEDLTIELTNQLAAKLPDFGESVAVDSTVVKAYANGNRKRKSDPDASWAVKNSAASKTGKEATFGYKYHAVADAIYDLPITGIVTTGSRSDMNMLLPLLDKAEEEYSWFSPKYVIADRGYDSIGNSVDTAMRGYSPIIHIRDTLKNRKNPKSRLYDGGYTFDGIPVCKSGEPMEYVRSDPKRGHLYRCAIGCKPKRRRGANCEDTWVNVTDNPRRFPPVRRDSPRWKELYAKRQSIERVFKSSKQSRRLEAHHVRGIERIRLHMAMSMLTFHATALMHLQAGEAEFLRWQVRKIA